jgi:hypothetical protein
MFDLPQPHRRDDGWSGLADAIADWLGEGAGPSDLEVSGMDPEAVLNAAWTLHAAGALHGAVWLCGALPPQAALARLWARVRPQQSVSRRALAGLADDCLAALDHVPGPCLLVIDAPAWDWRGWDTTGSVLRVWLRDASAFAYRDPTGDDFAARLSGLPWVAIAEREDRLGDEARVQLAGWYREMGAAGGALEILPEVPAQHGALGLAVALERGKSLAALGRHNEAIAALDAWRAEVAPGTVDHVLAAEVDLLVATSCALLGRWGPAEAAARQALQSRMATSGEDSVWAATAMIRLGRIYTTTDKARDAERCFRCAVTMLDAVEPGSPTAAHARALWLDALEVSLRRGEMQP